MTAVRVVGVALLDPSPGGCRVLAARRTSPPDVAGGWELPGGKCEPGEDLATAAVREVQEELRCRIRVTGRLSAASRIRDGWTLEVVTAVLTDGRPVPTEHDEVRWLTAEQLDEVRWLPADVPFLPELTALLAGGGKDRP